MQEEYMPFILFGVVFIAIGTAFLISAALSGRKGGHRECAERVIAHYIRITNKADVVEKESFLSAAKVALILA